ncbi:MAG: serine O-acetyltransferase [Gammaproteobacteria bacterium]|nr:serine O-acetyltransferase [Gammaproteobacteria bacterium]NND38428.1 serine O-acetyltransferase [Pseudomonadales bacterium]NNL10908.1 serine O-acetyltransferase [Pseudomonadales bacterium]NNM12088.1 serine O-acetyltransferase [Pseudomonadales bacterium]RZV56157.1 MAG: serine O-acetyltransferase [Pseudomonadales bacterium]
MREQVRERARSEPLLASFFYSSVLEHADFTAALASKMAMLLESPAVSALVLDDLFSDCLRENPDIASAALADLQAVYERDPACNSYCLPFLYLKGYQSIQAQRLAHHLWGRDRKSMARYMQHIASLRFQVDAHPAAKLGRGIMFDHATGIVIGETAEIGDNASLLHGVTLGGSGKSTGKRHPTIGNGVMISCGAKILGDIRIGHGVKIGGGSVVLESVPDHVTIVGVPARIVGTPSEDSPAFTMEQDISR